MEECKPYIVTEDLQPLMKEWSEVTGFAIPDDDFFNCLRDELIEHLKELFQSVRLVSYSVLRNRLTEKIEGWRNNNTLVSLDRIYNEAHFYIESNRIMAVHKDKERTWFESIGLGPRPKFPPPGRFPLIKEQIEEIPKDVPIVLIDDGCYSGESLVEILNLFSESGHKIKKIIIGIFTGRAKSLLSKRFPDIEIDAVYEFPNSIDWVCERDFLVGAPYSGRTLGTKSQNMAIPFEFSICLPYCLSFSGDPVEFASIPTGSKERFSVFIIDRSIRLWKKIEELSGKVITTNDVPRIPYKLERNNDRFVDYLEGAKLELEKRFPFVK